MFFRKKPVSWIVVFLGNPGAKYADTRHNAGFMTAGVLESRLNIRINKLKFKSLTASCSLGGESVLLMKPQTYMNRSGDAVREAAGFYKVPLDRVLAVSDDMALPLGKIRVRRSGSSGGHNGLKDIALKCGGDGFPRVKIGIGAPPHPDFDVADWVLSTFKNQEAAEIREACKTAADAVETIVKSGVDEAMGRFN